MMTETKKPEKVVVEFVRRKPPYMIGDVAGFAPDYAEGLLNSDRPGGPLAKPYKPKKKLPGLRTRQMDAGDKGSGYVTKG